MKSGPLDQTRFKSGHQISQTSSLKRRVDLDRRIFCPKNLSHTSSAPIYRKYRRYIADIFDISAIYLPEKPKKNSTRACLPSVDISTDISVRFRYFAEISPIFSDFSRFFLQTIFCIKNRFVYARYPNIADISKISILGHIRNPIAQ